MKLKIVHRSFDYFLESTASTETTKCFKHFKHNILFHVENMAKQPNTGKSPLGDAVIGDVFN